FRRRQPDDDLRQQHGRLHPGGGREDRILREGIYRRGGEHGLAATLLPQRGAVLIMTSALRLLLATFALLAGIAALPQPAEAERLKDLVSFQGVRDNPLIGYGLVVGLDGH